jgi:hypothetical protein
MHQPDKKCSEKRAASKAKYRHSAKGKLKNAASKAAWYKANKEAIAEKKRAAYFANAEAIRAERKEYRKNNPEKTRAAVNGWAKKNPTAKLVATRKYQAARLSAVPSWADDVLIARYYMFARFLTEATGIPWEVDHIIPLQSKLVCGLHVQDNLTFMPAAWNTAKGNKLIELPA